MSWMEKGQRSRLDDFDIEGLYYLDGNVLAYFYARLAGEGGVPFVNPDWIKGQKLPQIEFPSGETFDIWASSNGGIVHIFGEMDLPYFDTADRAWEHANYVAEQCGYLARRKGDHQIEVIGHDEAEHYLITYDAKRMTNIQKLEPVPYDVPRVPLLDEASQAKLPPLYANDGMGLEAVAQVKFFTPDSGWTWYATEYDPDEGIFFGLVIGLEAELGYFSLGELEELRGPLGLRVERDRYFEPATLQALKDEHNRY